MTLKLRVMLWALAICISPSFSHAQKIPSKETSPLVKEGEIQIQGYLRQAKNKVALRECLSKEKDPWIRGRCVETLGKIGDPAFKESIKNILSQEKNQQVRRMMAEALFLLGDRGGVEELLWQLRSGTNFNRAKSAEFLTAITGLTFGQDAAKWWKFLGSHEAFFLNKKPNQDYPLVDLGKRKLPSPLSQGFTVHGKTISDGKTFSMPAVIINLPPKRTPIYAEHLKAFEAEVMKIPDGALLIINTNHKDAPVASKEKVETPSPKPNAIALEGPGLTEDAFNYLPKVVPNHLGIIIDTPSIDLPSSKSKPIANKLQQNKCWLLEGGAPIKYLPMGGFQIFFTPDCRGGACQAVQITALQNR